MNRYAYELWMKLWNMPYETFLKIEPECEEIEEIKEVETLKEFDQMDEVIELLKELITLQKEMIYMWRYE